jgi:putative peptidoglycan lipid II flippase
MVEGDRMEEARQITRAAGVIGLATLLSRVTGLARDMVVGYLFGAQGAADAFFVAFRIPNLLRRLTAEGALTAGFVPVFTHYLANRGRFEAMRIARLTFTLTALALALVTAAGIWLADPLTRLFAPGFATDEEKFGLTVLLTRLMFPYLFFVSLVALAMGLLNSLRHFLAPALSPVLLNLSIIAAAMTLPVFFHEPVIALAWGVLMGGAAQLLLQVPYLSRFGFSYEPDFSFRDPAIKRLLLFMGPGFVGAAVYQINVLVSTILASLLPEGSVSYLYYADRLLQFPLGIFAVALGTAALPSFSSLVAGGKLEELKRSLGYALGLVNFVSLPAALGLAALAVPIFALLFQRGAFDAQTTLAAADALIFFSLGLWGVSGTRVAVAVFYAMEDTKTPAFIAFLSFLINLASSLVFMGAVEVEADASGAARAIAGLSAVLALTSLSHAGLALATSASATFNFLALLYLLRRRIGAFPIDEFARSFFRNLGCSLVMSLPILFISRQIDWTDPARHLTTQGMIFASLLFLGISIYFGLSAIVRGPEWQFLRQLLRKWG